MSLEEKQVQISTTIRHRDYRAVAYFNLFQRHRYEPYAVLAVASLAVVILIGKILPWFHPDVRQFHGSWVFLTFLLLVLAITEIMVHQYIKADRQAFLCRYEITVSVEGLQVATSGGKAAYQWRRMFKGFELKRHFLFFLNISQAVILPKRDMDEEQCQFVCQAAQEGMGIHFQQRYRQIKGQKSKEKQDKCKNS